MKVFIGCKIIILILLFPIAIDTLYVYSQEEQIPDALNLNIELYRNKDIYCKFEFSYSSLNPPIDLLPLKLPLLEKTKKDSIKIYYTSSSEPEVKQMIEIDSLTEKEVITKEKKIDIPQNEILIITYEFIISEAFVRIEDSSLEIWDSLLLMRCGKISDFNIEIRLPPENELEKGYISYLGVRLLINFQAEKISNVPVTIKIHGTSFNGNCPLFFYLFVSEPEITLSLTDRIFMKDFQDIILNKDDFSITNLTNEKIIFCVKRDKEDVPILYIFEEEENCDSIYHVEAKTTKDGIRGKKDYPLSDERVSPLHKEMWLYYPFDKYKISLKQEFSSLFEKDVVGSSYRVRYNLIVDEPENFEIWNNKDNVVKVWAIRRKVVHSPIVKEHLYIYEGAYQDKIFMKNSYSHEITTNDSLPLEFVLNTAFSTYTMEISIVIGRAHKWLYMSSICTLLCLSIGILKFTRYKRIISIISLKEINLSPVAIFIFQIGFFYLDGKFPIEYIYFDKLIIISFIVFFVSFCLDIRKKLEN